MTLPDYLQKQAMEYKLERARMATLRPAVWPDPVDWIEREFYIPETGGPIKLEPYQAAVIREALRRDNEGNFVYSQVLYSDIKKSAKSTISGAVALYLAWHSPYETVRIVGNDLKQADSRTFFYIKRAIEMNPRLSTVCHVKHLQITLPNRTTIAAIPVDPKGEAGGGDLIICFTELWAMKNEASQTLWSETTLSPLKFGKSLRWAESYAGRIGESPILEQLYDVGVKHGQQIDIGIPGLEVYQNEAARMFAMWNTQPRCKWQTPQYYAQEQSVLTPDEFLRMHRNQWGNAMESFVPLEWWDACLSPLPEFAPYVPMVVALDAAVESDCFAMVGISRLRHTDEHGKENPRIYVRYVRIWTPPIGGKIQFSSLNPDDVTPESEVRRLSRTYNVECFAYDKYQLHSFCETLEREGVGYFKEFDQGQARLVADKGLYDKIRHRQLIHSGEADLREHIGNANRKTENERLRIVKRKETLKIDGAVATSMAAQTAEELEL